MCSADARREPLVVFLMGPTASGKTELAVELAARFPFDVISVDSALVYRGMDIGTAKPGPDVRAAVPHHLIDICDPSETYSAARFRADALRAMADSVRFGRVPLLVGGTMLYFRVLQRGLSPLPAADPALRRRINQQAYCEGWDSLHRRLASVDPVAASRIHPNDPQRIQRALEVYEITKKPMSELQRWGRVHAALPYRVLRLVRAPRDKTVLHRRIEQRFQRMLESGFEEEVAGLWARGDLTPELPSMRCVGYRQMLKYLLGEYKYDEMVERGIVATRHLAKRQLTWLRAEMEDACLVDTEQTVEQVLREAARKL